jgi:hypothetical protein
LASDGKQMLLTARRQQQLFIMWHHSCASQHIEVVRLHDPCK